MERKNGVSKLITLQINQDILNHDLVLFRDKTIELGASMAEIIPASWVEVDERVSLKCANPLCTYYGHCIHCPPHHGFSPDFIRKAFSRYQWAILFALDVKPVVHFAGNAKERQEGIKWSKKCMEIAGIIETLAFGNGYYLALGLAQSCCLRALCHQERCSLLEGKKCPYPLKSRSSIECLGVDVFRLVTKVGWEIYPIYRSVNPEKVLRALAVGIVFIY